MTTFNFGIPYTLSMYTWTMHTWLNNKLILLLIFYDTCKLKIFTNFVATVKYSLENMNKVHGNAGYKYCY